MVQSSLAGCGPRSLEVEFGAGFMTYSISKPRGSLCAFETMLAKWLEHWSFKMFFQFTEPQIFHFYWFLSNRFGSSSVTRKVFCKIFFHSNLFSLIQISFDGLQSSLSYLRDWVCNILFSHLNWLIRYISFNLHSSVCSSPFDSFVMEFRLAIKDRIHQIPSSRAATMLE